MKYMLLIHNSPEGMSENSSQEKIDAEMAAHTAFAGLIAPRGGTFYGEALLDPSTARSIRPSANGEFVVTDGPFADVKEQVGGYYVFEAKDMDEAVELARHCPSYAGIEVRQIWDIPTS